MVKHHIIRAWHSFVQLIYPDLCYGCGKRLLEQEHVLCLQCKEELPCTQFHLTADNEATLRLSGRVPFVHALSWAYYTKEGLLQYLLQELKYKGRQQVGTFLGKEMAYTLKKTSWIDDIDLIACVPLHAAKLRKRGYNQSLLVAEAIAAITGKPCSDQCLVRLRDTGTQTSKSRMERAENMQDAFSLADAQMVSGKHILLIDDVLTTGATIEACIRALMKADKVRVSVATIGIAMD